MRLKQAFFRCKVHRIVSISLFLWIFTDMFGIRSSSFLIDSTPRCLYRIRKAAEPKTSTYFFSPGVFAPHCPGTIRTFRSEKAFNAAEMETINYAGALCGDDASTRALSTFGGIQYFNTDVDKRFRVLFVLGGPGEFV